MSTPTTLVPLRRHARSLWPWLLGGNLAVVGAAVGVHALLSSLALPVAIQAVGAVAAGLLVLVPIVWVVRRPRDAVVGRLEWGPDALTVTLGRGRPHRCAWAEVRVRRVAYLPGEGGIGHAHMPVLELRLRGQTLRIAGHGAPAWPHPDEGTDSAPRYAVDAAQWSALVATFGAR